MIGVFDSGLGGLTILKYFLKQLPNYDYIYLGDNARAPYGSKSQEVIYNYTKEAVDFLFGQGCKLIIIACNSASAKALRRIQQEHLPSFAKATKGKPQKRVLGVIRPLVETVAQDATIQRVGVIGTKATIESDVYKIELHKLNPGLQIFQQSAPLLVPLIEEGWLKKPETKMIFKKYLHPLKLKQIQALIPACTHYPFLLKEMQRIMTKRCKVLNPGEIVAKSLIDYLKRRPELGIQPSPNPQLEFYTTDDINKFRELGEKFLGQKINKIEKIVLVLLDT